VILFGYVSAECHIACPTIVKTIAKTMHPDALQQPGFKTHLEMRKDHFLGESMHGIVCDFVVQNMSNVTVAKTQSITRWPLG
jgi:hypothetical protein